MDDIDEGLESLKKQIQANNDRLSTSLEPIVLKYRDELRKAAGNYDEAIKQVQRVDDLHVYLYT